MHYLFKLNYYEEKNSRRNRSNKNNSQNKIVRNVTEKRKMIN